MSRIPTIQIKRLLQKSKKVVIKVQKHVRRVVPQSSKLHAYLCKKSSAYHKLNSESYGIGDHQHRSARKQRSNLSKKDCCPKQQRLCLLFVQTRTRKHKKSVACVYTDEHGLKKLKCSCVQILCVAQHIIALSGDVEENPGPCTQINNDKNAQCAKQVNSVSLLESRLSELGRIPVNVLGDGNCFFRAVSCQLYNTPEYHLYIRSLGVQHLLHHPELYIESNFEYSWQNYMDNMARQGTWADNIIIQAVANFSPVTVINPVNSDRQTANIYIGHIQEYHYMSTIPVPNSNTYEMTSGNEPIQKSASSNKSELEQCKQKQFSQDKNAPLVNGDKENGKRAKLSEKDKAERRKASKREFIQKKRENPDYRKRENRMRSVASDCDTDMDLREKIERRKTSQREFIRKKRAEAVTRLKDNHKKIKLSEADKADKRRTNNRENIRKKRQNVQKVNIQNKANSVSLLESRLSELGRIPVNVLGDGNCFFRAVSCQLYNTPEYHLYIRSLGVQHLLHHPELYIESNFEYSWQNYMDNMARQGTWADNIIIQAVANFSPVTVINPVNSDRQTANIYIGHIQEYHYMSTIPVPNSNTYEMTSGNEPIQKSASSNKSELEQCKQKQFSQDKNAPLVNGDKENGKRAKLSEKDKAERRKASKREFIQKKRENPDYRKRENRMRSVASDCDTDMDLREKIERRKTSQREFIRKKRAEAVTRLKDNHKKIKLSEADKADKRRTNNRENMRKKRQNVQKVNIQNKANSVSLLESRLSELGRIPVNVLGDGNCFFRAVSCQLYNTPEYHLYIRSLGVQHLLHHPELYIESNFEYSWQNYMDNMARQGTWADNIIIQAVANSLNITINIIESDANFSPVTVINPVNSDRQTTNIYIGHIQEYHYMSTIPVPNSNTYEMTCGNEPIQKSASSNKSELEQCKQKQFSQDKHALLVYGDKENGKRPKLSEKDKAERRKASKREFIQKKREKPDYRKRENRMRSVASECDTNMELREKIERRRTSQREFVRKKRAEAVTRLKDNNKRIKLSEADKADKRRTSNRENMRKKRQNVQKVNILNKANCYHNGGVMSDPDANAYKSVINKFHKKISCGPEYICTCCDQLWYKSSVTKCNANNYSKCQQNIVQSCITGVKSVNNTEWICNTCHLNIKQGKLPQCSKANGMGFPDKPSVLDLTPLEERLISPQFHLCKSVNFQEVVSCLFMEMPCR